MQPDRLQTAEEQIAHLIRVTDDLSDMVARQGREIDALTRRVALLTAREAERQADGGGGPPAAEKPPHY